MQSLSTSNGLTFNANKTLCITFHHGHHVNEITQYTIFLGNDKLKWNLQVKHLGHTFNCYVHVSVDVAYRKGQFIGFAHPVCKLKLLLTHSYSFMVHPCGTSMTRIVKSDILLGTLQYADYMICL